MKAWERERNRCTFGLEKAERLSNCSRYNKIRLEEAMDFST